MPLWWRDPPQGLDKTTTPDDVALWVPEKKPGQFNPAPDDNLLAWYDASQLTLGNGANVTLWSDLSGHANDLVTSTFGGGNPTCVLAGLNGKRVVNFSGSQVLQGPPYLSNLNTNKPWSVAATIFVSSISVNFVLSNKAVPATSNGDTIPAIILLASSGNKIEMNIGVKNLSGVNINVTPLWTWTALNTWYSMIVTYDGTGRHGAIGLDAFSFQLGSIALPALTGGGGSGDPAASPMYPPNQLSTFVGARGDGSAGMAGQIAELLVYRVALNPTQKLQVDKYLRSKWNI